MLERRRRFLVVVITVLAIVSSSVLTAVRNHTAQSGVLSQVTSNSPNAASAKLTSLPVKGRAPKTGYSRTQFADAWASAGDCDVRNAILQRDMTDVVTKSPTDCTVLSGKLSDPYTGKTIQFSRGVGSSEAVEIDHVVAVSDAWQKGAQALATDLRRQFYNDPLNLLAVDGPTNVQKGDGDAATWLPPNKAYRCAYVARQIAVKVKYSLWVTSAERDAIKRVLNTCPGQTIPT